MGKGGNVVHRTDRDSGWYIETGGCFTNFELAS